MDSVHIGNMRPHGPTVGQRATTKNQGYPSRAALVSAKCIIVSVFAVLLRVCSVCLLFVCAASGTRTRTAISGQGILSPSCLPIPPLRQPRRHGRQTICKGKVISRNGQKFGPLFRRRQPRSGAKSHGGCALSSPTGPRSGLKPNRIRPPSLHFHLTFGSSAVFRTAAAILLSGFSRCSPLHRR